MTAHNAKNDDTFERAEYSVSYRSENGRLSKYLRIYDAKGTVRDVHLDTITPAQPNLWHAREQALKVMDDYNATFILGGAFPIVFQVLTMGTSAAPVTSLPSATGAGVAVRRGRSTGAPVVARESEGAVKPGTSRRVHIDPFSGETHPIAATARTERSTVTSIRADVAEADAYKVALVERGEIGLQRPTGSNVPGVDFITAILRPGTRTVVEVVGTDVKASVAGKFPIPKTSLPGAWRQEIRDAVAPARLKLGDPVLETEIRQAVNHGRIRLRQLKVNYSSDGQGTITGW